MDNTSGPMVMTEVKIWDKAYPRPYVSMWVIAAAHLPRRAPTYYTEYIHGDNARNWIRSAYLYAPGYDSDTWIMFDTWLLHRHFYMNCVWF